eukprot:3230473-Pleurochrysis_carterae.AAC.5
MAFEKLTSCGSQWKDRSLCKLHVSPSTVRVGRRRNNAEEVGVPAVAGERGGRVDIAVGVDGVCFRFEGDIVGSLGAVAVVTLGNNIKNSVETVGDTSTVHRYGRGATSRSALA